MAARPQAPAAATPVFSSSPSRCLQQPDKATDGDGYQLPKGPCNFRESSVRGGGIPCGCRRFWLDSVGHGGRSSTQTRNAGDSAGTAWCMCKHHACFHDEEDQRRANATVSGSINPNLAVTPVHVRHKDVESTSTPLYLLVQSPAGLQRGSSGGAGVLDPSILGNNVGRPTSSGVNTASSSFDLERALQDSPHGFDFGGHHHETPGAIAAAEQALTHLTAEFVPDENFGSQASESCLPPIPSEFLLSPRHLRQDSAGSLSSKNGFKPQSLKFTDTSKPNTATPIADANQATGLGLGIHTRDSPGQKKRGNSAAASGQSSYAKHIPMQDHEAELQSRIEQELYVSATKRQYTASEQSTPYVASMIPAFQPTQHKRLQTPLRTRSLIASRNAPNFPRGTPEHSVQSATELATPSQANTPDLRAIDDLETRKTVRDLIGALDVLDREVKKVERGNIRPRRSSAQSSLGTNEHSPGQLDDGSKDVSGASSSSLLGATTRSSDLITSLSLVLPPLKSLLTSYPTILDAIKTYTTRIDLLENASFSNAPFEDLHQKVELVEDRVLEVEGKVDDLDKWRVSLDEDTSTIVKRRRTSKGKPDDGALNVANTSTSFVSTVSSTTSNSCRSNTSSALIAAAIERSEMMARLEMLSSKVLELESAAPPSASRPWEVEVVFIPWGRTMTGIWFPADDFPASSARSQTQGEGWTQVQGPATLSRTNSMHLREVKSGGWTGAAIRQWAEGTDNWMAPKAFNQRSRVYERLRSRGLVRTVQVPGNGAVDVQAATMAAFGGLIGILNGAQNSLFESSNDSVASTNDLDSTLPLGLSAPFIPLRKLHKDSRLRFLNPEEIVTSALWTVDFLNSGAVMRATGGQKRLFVTHRDGYLQSGRDELASWTWQKLRELPRVDLTDPAAANELTSSGQVREADARERCWEWDPRLDPPVSSTSTSFVSGSSHGSSNNSFQAKQLEGPLSTDQHSSGGHSTSQSGSIVPRAKSPRPISPVSQFTHSVKPLPPQQNDMPPTTRIPAYAGISKRRTPSASSPIKPSTLTLHHHHQPSSASKRRRTTRSPTFEDQGQISPSSRDQQHNAVWTSTPRRSNPPSPFFSEVGVPRSASDVGGAATMTGVVIQSKRGSTPFAYATPHSGPMMVRELSTGRRGDIESLVGSEEEGEGSSVSGRIQGHGEDEVWEGVDTGGEEEVFVKREVGDDGEDDEDEDGDGFFEEVSVEGGDEDVGWDS